MTSLAPDLTTQVVPPPAQTPGERTIRPEFTGSAGEYFRIWIVNLFFTLVTFGVYSAWAKVRKKRYFYGNTRLDGDTFDYFASPKAILKGRIVAVVVVVVYAFAGELYPSSRYAFWALGAVVLPWLIVRALGFNAANSAYRGLRFVFSGKPREALNVFLGMLLLVVLTAGLAYPWFMARFKTFIVTHHAFGTTRFGCELPGRAFFWIYLRGTLILLAVAIPIGALAVFAFSRPEVAEFASWGLFLIPLVAIYAAYAVAYAYTQARTTNLQWNNTFGAGMRFSSTLGAARLARLYIGNVAAVAATAGLLIPWAVVRTLRYRLENFALIVEEDLVHDANPALAPVGATGQELGDLFNLDLGL